MNYRALFKTELNRMFTETDMSVGEILRTITMQTQTEIIIPNRGRFLEIPDEKWYLIVEAAIKESKIKDSPYEEQEWKAQIEDKWI